MGWSDAFPPTVDVGNLDLISEAIFEVPNLFTAGLVGMGIANAVTILRAHLTILKTLGIKMCPLEGAIFCVVYTFVGS